MQMRQICLDIFNMAKDWFRFACDRDGGPKRRTSKKRISVTPNQDLTVTVIQLKIRLLIDVTVVIITTLNICNFITYSMNFTS